MSTSDVRPFCSLTFVGGMPPVLHPPSGEAVPSFEDLHLHPPIAAALESAGVERRRSRVARGCADRGTGSQSGRGHAARAGLCRASAGRTSRADWRAGAGPVLAPAGPAGRVGRAGRIALAQDTGLRVQVAHGTARAMRRLQARCHRPARRHAGDGADAGRPVRTQNGRGDRAVLAWPESWDGEDSITPLMQDLPKDAQRSSIHPTPDGSRAWWSATPGRR